MTFIQQLLTRLQTENPAFYKKLQTIAMILGAICVVVIGFIKYDIVPFEASEKVLTAAYALITFCGGIVFTSATTTTDSRLMDKKTIDNVLKYKKSDNKLN